MPSSNILLSFEKKLLDNLQRVNATNDLVVALSGGLDSKALLHALVHLRELKHVDNIQAIHVNHGLQQVSEQWRLTCHSDCEQYKVKIHSTDLNLSNDCHSNIEAEARDARYQFFESILSSKQWLLMAHHLDDQAETLLFRLLRGCGLNGAKAMPEQRKLGRARLLRPLLDISQAEILDYAKQKKLSWIEDPTNSDEKYSRNFLRHQITPRVKSRWPTYAKVLSRFSKLVTEQVELLDEVAAEDLQKLGENRMDIDVPLLLRLSPVRQKNCLHYWGKINGLSAPSSNEIEALISQLGASVIRSITVNFSGLVVRSYLARLYLVSKKQPLPISKRTPWKEITHTLVLENGIEMSINETSSGGMRFPVGSEQVWVDRRNGGEKCLADYRSKTAELKKIYQELQVPTWKREWLPIVYFDEEIAAVPGYFVAKKFLAGPNSKSFTIDLLIKF